MGCDIHSYAEKKTDSGYVYLNFEPFEWRSYAVFGFLANVRNYSDVKPIAEGYRGLPEDVSPEVAKERDYWGSDGHSTTWLSINELSDFDYDQPIEDRRCRVEISPGIWSGGETCPPGQGEKTTYRKFLGSYFFTDLKKLQDIGADRVVFWFDN